MVSDRFRQARQNAHCRVLILVLMEYGLWQVSFKDGESIKKGVLILVLMEYGLWRPLRIS